jgi:pyrroline-5-carboxylate reductase
MGRMNQKSKKLGFIGAGNMATALVKGIIESKKFGAARIKAFDIDKDQLKALVTGSGIEGTGSNRQLIGDCRIVVLAVKPQHMRDVLGEIKEGVTSEHLIISIAAGIPLKTIQDSLVKKIPLVRVMPNTPALIQMGMSALAAGKYATEKHLAVAVSLFEAVGETVTVPEGMMDAVTAVSGSGPGYLFRIMESFVKAAEGLGFDPATALKLVLQTALGASRLASTSDRSLSELWAMVASPGGTTAAGLAEFEKRGLEQAIGAGVEAAFLRSVELGKKS